jgi:glycosyltransferase involved in cell wall biosynthesis
MSADSLEGNINVTLSANARFAEAKPRLSVLIPFYKESPCALLRALATQAVKDVEIIILDDGSDMPDLSQDVISTLMSLDIAAILISLSENEGRAKGRNRLTTQARGDYYLCLDADMLPDAPDFLNRWAEVASKGPYVVFGGFSLIQAPQDKAYDIHRLMASQSDCLPAEVRALRPEKYIFTSNLLIKRDVFTHQEFDGGFTGWGWEDVEWAMRVSKQFGVTHIDNTATHMGLDPTSTLIQKYEQSVVNFARVVAKHPEIVTTYPSYKVAKLIKALPFHTQFKNTCKAITMTPWLPLGLRALSLRVYRSALYAEVV